MSKLEAELIIEYNVDGKPVTTEINVLDFDDFPELEAELLTYNIQGQYEIGLRSNILPIAFVVYDDDNYVMYRDVNSNNEELKLSFSYLINEYISEIMTLANFLKDYDDYNDIEVLELLFAQYTTIDDVITAIDNKYFFYGLPEDYLDLDCEASLINFVSTRHEIFENYLTWCGLAYKKVEFNYLIFIN